MPFGVVSELVALLTVSLLVAVLVLCFVSTISQFSLMYPLPHHFFFSFSLMINIPNAAWPHIVSIALIAIFPLSHLLYFLPRC